MKRMIAISVCLCLLLMTGCGQTASPPAELPQTTPSAAPPSDTTAAAPPATPAASRQERVTTPVLCFSGEIPDPQDMQPTYEPGTLTFEGTLAPQENGGYSTDLHLTRFSRQGINPMTGEPRAEGYMNFSYDSGETLKTGEIATEAKAALEKASTGDAGERQYGTLPMQTRSTQHSLNVTPTFLLPYDNTNAFSTVTEIPYLLTREGEKAALYLYLNPVAIVKLDGALAAPPAPPKPEKPSTLPALYLNAEGRTAVVNSRKEVWNLLFLGKGGAQGYTGTLRLWRWAEKTGSYPSILPYVTGDTDAYEKQVTIAFAPFDEAAYLAAGGTLNPQRRALLSGMATTDCGGQAILLTACGDAVYAELPGVPIGALQGVFSGDGALSRIHDESLALCKAAHAQHNTAPASPPDGIGVSEKIPASIEMTQTYFGGLSSLPAWLPPAFLPMTQPVDMIEKRPSTGTVSNFQYIEDGLWLDEIGPIYRAYFANMREVQIKEGETDEIDYEMEITFRYGERVVAINISDGLAGAAIVASIY